MEGKKFLKLNDIEAYRIAFKLSNQVWDIVLKWDYFAKDTIGKQFVKSVDSISATSLKALGDIQKKIKLNFSDIVLGLYMSL
jgi:hypothetical protein